MKTKYPLDWHTVIVTVVVGVLGTVIFGWYFRILSAGAIVPSPMWAGASSGI